MSQSVPLTPSTVAPNIEISPRVEALLTGKVSWDADMWHELLHWALNTGLSLVLVVVLTLLGIRAYDAGVTHVFKLINANMQPDAMARVTQRTNTLSGILRSLGKTAILFLGLVTVLAKLGVNVAPILASAGILGLAVGFGAQSLVKDVISGFFILIEDQYGVGDVIDVNGKGGLVEKMNLRITQLRNLDGNLITIPNGSIQLVVNHSKEWARTVLEIGVAYSEDPDRVMAVLKEIGAEVQAELPDKVTEPIEVLGIDAFRESEVVIKLTLKTKPLEQWGVARAFRRKVWYRFKAEGIEIPFPQRTLWLANAPSEPQGEKLTALVLKAREGAEAVE